MEYSDAARAELVRARRGVTLSSRIPALARQVLARRPVRYVLVGGVGFLINLGLFMALVRLLGLDLRIAEVISRSTGGVFTFLGHRAWTFRAGAAGHRHSAGAQGGQYLVLNLVNLAIAPWVVWGCAWLLDGLLVLAKLLAEAIMLLETYLLTALIFRPADTADAG